MRTLNYYLTALFIILMSLGQTFAQNKLSNKEKNEGWEVLFNGKNFEGWRGVNKPDFPAKGWRIKKSTITNTGEHGGSIITQNRYGDFELSWEWKMLTKGGNSGLKYFVVEKAGDEGGYGYGVEYQLLDDENFEWMSNGKMKPNDYRTLGAAYELYPPSAAKQPKKLGKWNRSKIVSNKGQVEHWLNGVLIVQYNRFSQDFKSKVALSKFKDVTNFGLHEEGHILLQDHGSEVYFRNLKIKSL